MDMRLFARTTSLVALVVARAEWRRLRTHLGSAYACYRTAVRPRLPETVPATLVAAEDPRFHRHGGVDPLRLARALWRRRLHRTLDRGSTIEHRLVRILAGRGERHTAALVRALLVASLVGRVVPKAEIPGLYLSVAHFGWRMDGIQRACRRLGFDLRYLTPLQAASIVARLRYPEPEVVSPRRARRIAARAEQVLRLSGAETSL